MSNFEKEVPNSRINIRLDLPTRDGRKSVELPFHILIVGNLSNQEEMIPLSERKKFKINKLNFNQVMKEICPSSRFSIPNLIKNSPDFFEVDICFEKISDFNPSALTQKIQPLKSLIGMRNLLRDLKLQTKEDHHLRNELEMNRLKD